MYNYLNFYQKNIIHYELVNKFNYNNTKNLPKLKKIILSFKNKNYKIKNFAATLFIIELITTKKCTFTTAKKPNLFLKIQKGQPIGGQLILKKTIMYNFITIFNFEISPKITNLIVFKTNNQNNFSLKLNNNYLTFLNVKEHYNLINLIPYIVITIITTAKTEPEFYFLLKSFHFNFKYKKKV